MNLSIETEFVLGLSALVIVLFLLWRRSVKLLKDTKFAKYSLSSKYGKMTEQFMPLLKNYPYDPQSFRFLGSPIDGVQFTPEGIIFIEFKANTSQLSFTQKQIREMINQKKVKFETIRI